MLGSGATRLDSPPSWSRYDGRRPSLLGDRRLIALVCGKKSCAGIPTPSRLLGPPTIRLVRLMQRAIRIFRFLGYWKSEYKGNESISS